MARPKKQIVDYFPHSCNHGKTIFILQNKYGNDGYAMWFKVLELLGQTEGHVYDCNDPAAWEFLLAKTLVSEELALKILQTLADLEAINIGAWSSKIIWSSNFVENLNDVYVRRKCEKPSFPASLLDYYQQKTPLSGISVNINPQSKVKESKGKESKVNNNTDEAFFEALKNNTAYAHINFEQQWRLMDAWFLKNPTRHKTRRFIVNWLNKVEPPVMLPKPVKPALSPEAIANPSDDPLSPNYVYDGSKEWDYARKPDAK